MGKYHLNLFFFGSYDTFTVKDKYFSG